ncbi:Homoaconitase, mitochondrial [Clarias magur]|uniref:Homoaconitase, mitochondrial n=1 Tax=Clarias magur TaxID=1594786 RepID=A0A8J4TVE7_CLAMG|nr:Homoaconitase, mitochondrial [Clarias magur]
MVGTGEGWRGVERLTHPALQQLFHGKTTHPRVTPNEITAGGPGKLNHFVLVTVGDYSGKQRGKNMPWSGCQFNIARASRGNSTQSVT